MDNQNYNMGGVNWSPDYKVTQLVPNIKNFRLVRPQLGDIILVKGDFTSKEVDILTRYLEEGGIKDNLVVFIKENQSLESVSPEEMAKYGWCRNDWKPIESAPKDGTPILALENSDVYKASWDGESESWISFCGQPVCYTPEPTHWIHLPEIK